MPSDTYRRIGMPRDVGKCTTTAVVNKEGSKYKVLEGPSRFTTSLPWGVCERSTLRLHTLQLRYEVVEPTLGPPTFGQGNVRLIHRRPPSSYRSLPRV